MDLPTRPGQRKSGRQRDCPLTGIGCVMRIDTDLCILARADRSLVPIDAIEGLSITAQQALRS